MLAEPLLSICLHDCMFAGSRQCARYMRVVGLQIADDQEAQLIATEDLSVKTSNVFT